MTKDDIISMAQEVGATQIGHEPPAFHFYIENLEHFTQLAFEKGREQGMKQEHALWLLAKTSQEIQPY